MISYLIAAICMASLLSAHVHLSENHGGSDLHSHATEIHFAHFASTHDNLDAETQHATESTAVDIDGEVGPTGMWKILDVLTIVTAILLLLIVPFRTQQPLPLSKTPHRCPRYSPLRARAPPR